MSKRFYNDVINGRVMEDEEEMDLVDFMRRSRRTRPYEDDDEEDAFGEDIDSGLLNESEEDWA